MAFHLKRSREDEDGGSYNDECGKRQRTFSRTRQENPVQYIPNTAREVIIAVVRNRYQDKHRSMSIVSNF